jgi:hypothetical protein
MAEQYFLYTYGGEGARWYTHGDELGIESRGLDESPPAQRELIQQDRLRHSDRALVLFVDADKRWCCLVQGIETDQTAGNVQITHHLLIVGGGDGPSPRQLGLARLFLLRAPVHGEPGEFHLDHLARHVKGVHDGVRIDWRALVALLDEAAIESSAHTRIAAEAHVGGAEVDSTSARKRVLDSLAHTAARSTGRIALAVVPRQLRGDDVGTQLYGMADTPVAADSAGDTNDRPGAPRSRRPLTHLVQTELEQMSSTAAPGYQAATAVLLQRLWHGKPVDRADVISVFKQLPTPFERAWFELSMLLIALRRADDVEDVSRPAQGFKALLRYFPPFRGER